jgi:precorrin-2 dehydrogenase/sirohydrochlorin ferrochelatase
MAATRQQAGVEAVRAMLDRWRERGRDWQSPGYYPAFLNLESRRCVVIGAGKVGKGKIEGLLRAGARVRVVAEEAIAAVETWAQEGRIELDLRAYRQGDLEGAFLVIAATEQTDVNEAVFAEAEERLILCNVVDVPRLCSFILPSIHRDGPLAIAISTGGASPALARKLRLELGDRYGPEHGVALELLGALRDEAKERWPSPDDRKVIFERMVYAPAGGGGRRLVDLVRDGEVQAIEEWVEACIEEGPEYASRAEHQATIAAGLEAGVAAELADPSN